MKIGSQLLNRVIYAIRFGRNFGSFWCTFKTVFKTVKNHWRLHAWGQGLRCWLEGGEERNRGGGLEESRSEGRFAGFSAWNVRRRCWLYLVTDSIGTWPSRCCLTVRLRNRQRLQYGFTHFHRPPSWFIRINCLQTSFLGFVKLVCFYL